MDGEGWIVAQRMLFVSCMGHDYRGLRVRGYGADRGMQEGLMKRAALYMRVSTKGHGQTTDTQALALREYVAHRRFQITEEYRDEGISGSKDSRPALDR